MPHITVKLFEGRDKDTKMNWEGYWPVGQSM